MCFIICIDAVILLYQIYVPSQDKKTIPKTVLYEKYEELGAINREEKWVGLLFCLMAFLWIFRAPIEIGTMTIPGWSTLLINPGYINDGTIAIAMATLLFLIPGGKKEIGRASCREWE